MQMRYREMKCYSPILNTATQKGNQFQFTGSPKSIPVPGQAQSFRSVIRAYIQIFQVQLSGLALLLTAAAAQRVAYSIRV